MTEEPRPQQIQAAERPSAKKSIIGLWPFALSLIVFLPLVYWYVGQEAPCYWSDFNYYEWATRFSISQLGQNPATYPILLLTSVSLQHNLYFTVPLVPIMAALGGDRAAYIVSIFLVYFLPLAYCIARLSTDVERSITDVDGSSSDIAGSSRNSKPAKVQPAKVQPAKSTVQAFALCLLIPVLLAPTLRGYPDSGAALTLISALLLYIENRSFDKPKRGALIGFLLALTVLLRRYVAFAGVSLVLCIAVDQLLLARQNRATGKSRLKTFCALAASGALSMVCLGLPFLLNLTKLNLGVLYESYHVSVVTSVIYFFNCFGIITWLFALGGYVLAWQSKTADRTKLAFILAFYAISQALWILGPGELGSHYTLYFSPPVALGVVLFVRALSPKPMLAAGAVLFLLLNFGLSFAPSKTAGQLGLKPFRPGMLSLADQEGSGAALLFSASYPPYERGDLDKLKFIVDQLRAHYPMLPSPQAQGQAQEKQKQDKQSQEKQPQDKQSQDKQSQMQIDRGQVAVVACSYLLNHEVLRNVERAMYGLNNDKIQWLELPVVDSKDSYPLERLLSCQYVVVPSTNQYFIAPAGQSIMAGSKACFDQKWPLAGDFKLLPGSLTIDGGVKVDVYDRTRATTPATAALTLTKMKKFTPQEPGSQPDWITTGQRSQICYDKKRSQWEFTPGIYRPGFFCEEDRYLLYTHDLPRAFTLSGSLQTAGGTPPLTLRAQILGADGQLIEQVDLAGTAGKDAGLNFIHDFGQISVPGAAAAKYLVIILDLPPQAMEEGARAVVYNLKVEARP